MSEAPSTRRSLTGGLGLVVGVILLLVGTYYLLRETLGFHLPAFDWGAFWPVIVLLIGLGLVLRTIGKPR